MPKKILSPAQDFLFSIQFSRAFGFGNKTIFVNAVTNFFSSTSVAMKSHDVDISDIGHRVTSSVKL